MIARDWTTDSATVRTNNGANGTRARMAIASRGCLAPVAGASTAPTGDEVRPRRSSDRPRSHLDDQAPTGRRGDVIPLAIEPLGRTPQVRGLPDRPRARGG